MTRGRSVAYLLWFAVLTVSIAIVSRTPFSTDMSAFLPRSPSAAQQVLVDQLREGIASRLILVAIEGAPEEVLARLSQRTARELRGEGAFGFVANGEEASLAKDRRVLWRYRYLLSPGVTPEAFSATELHRALERDVQLLSSPLGVVAKRALPADPTREMLRLIGEFAGSARPQMRDGVWFSRSGKRALLMAQTSAAGFDIDGQEKALAAIRAAFHQAREAVPETAAARIIVTGPPVFAVGTRARMQSDAEHFSAIATILVAAILLLAYRSPRMLALGLLPVATGALSGIAAVSLAFGFVHGITLGFGVTLIGEGVDYAIYLFTQTSPGSSPEATLPRIWPTLLLGMLTSVFGFSAMLLSSFTGFEQLGLFTIIGLVAALATTRWVLPPLVPRNFSVQSATAFAAPLIVLSGEHRWLRFVIPGAIALAATTIALHRGSYWESELSSMSPVPPAEKALDRALRREMGAPDVRYLLVIEAKDRDEALVASEQVARRLSPLIESGLLTGFDSPDRFLPSEETQRARRTAIPDNQKLSSNLEAALKGTPFRSGTFARFLADAEASRSGMLLKRSSLDGTSLALRLDSLLVPDPSGWIALLPLRGVENPQRLAIEIADLGMPRLLFLDLKRESDRLLSTFLSEALTLSVTGSIAILALLTIAFRDPRRIARVVEPLVGAVVCTAALLLLIQGQLSIFNLFGLLLVVAIGSNYSLFFEREGRDGKAGRPEERVVASLALANLCTVIGFGILGFSAIPVLHGIGATVAIGAFLSLVFGAMLSSCGGISAPGAG